MKGARWIVCARALLVSLALGWSPPTGHAQRPAETEAFSVIEHQGSPAEILARFEETDGPIRVEGDVLTFFHREHARAVRVEGSLDVPMSRVGDTDLWTVALRVPRLPEAVLRYRFASGETGETDHPPPGERLFRTWRGPEAPDPPPRVSILSGQLLEHTIESRALGEPRRITVYVPPRHDSRHRDPVVYMADGENVSDYAAVLEAAILEGKIPATVMVGVHSGGYRGDREDGFDLAADVRSQEYLAGFDRFVPGVDSTRFVAHERFFLHEVARWAEERLGIARDRKRRVLFGTSNSAAFAVSVGIRHPECFGWIVALSLGWQEALVAPEWDAVYPSFYLSAGTLEKGFLDTTSRWFEMLARGGYRHEFRERVSGHDEIMWQEEFARALVWALGGERGTTSGAGASPPVYRPRRGSVRSLMAPSRTRSRSPGPGSEPTAISLPW